MGARKDRLDQQPTTVHDHAGSAVSLHGGLWCYRDIFLAPYKSGRRQAIDDAMPVSSSLGQRPLLAVPARGCIHFVQRVVLLSMALERRVKVCSESACTHMCHNNQVAYIHYYLFLGDSCSCHTRKTTTAQPHTIPPIAGSVVRLIEVVTFYLLSLLPHFLYSLYLCF
jgi:hypothetical protein